MREAGVVKQGRGGYEPCVIAVDSTATGYRYIRRVTGDCGGNAILEGTRIGVHDTVGALQNGKTVESLIERCFKELSRAQVFECLAYYGDHRGEIDVPIARQVAVKTE